MTLKYWPKKMPRRRYGAKSTKGKFDEKIVLAGTIIDEYRENVTLCY